MLTYRSARQEDVPLLACLNRQLIEDEGHPNPMTVPELEARMRGWLAGEYQVGLFEECGRVVAYVLYRCEGESIHVRHLFVVRDRRRRGIATEALRCMAREVWPAGARVTLEVLAGNSGAQAFYRRLGFAPYSLALEIDGARLAGEAEQATGDAGA